MSKSLSIAHAVKKKAKQMAHGGHVKGVHKPALDEKSGESHAGYEAIRAKKTKMHPEYREEHLEKAKDEHYKVLGELVAMKKPNIKGLAHGGMACPSCGYADGGEVEDSSSDPVVDMIMSKHNYSQGGKVANEGMDNSFKYETSNEFDDLVLDDDLESSYTGANSGDELGNAQEDEDRSEVIDRILKSRRKKDRMPNPA